MELTKEHFEQFAKSLLAHLDERFSVIDERFEATNSRFDQNDSRFDRIENRLDGLDKKISDEVGGLTAKIDGIEGRIDRLDTKIDSVDQKIDTRTVELKDYIHEAFETQQTWMETRFYELLENHKLTKQVQQMQLFMTKIATKVGMEYTP